jgi:hypothetical protein
MLVTAVSVNASVSSGKVVIVGEGVLLGSKMAGSGVAVTSPRGKFATGTGVGCSCDRKKSSCERMSALRTVKTTPIARMMFSRQLSGVINDFPGGFHCVRHLFQIHEY